MTVDTLSIAQQWNGEFVYILQIVHCQIYLTLFLFWTDNLQNTNKHCWRCDVLRQFGISIRKSRMITTPTKTVPTMLVYILQLVYFNNFFNSYYNLTCCVLPLPRRYKKIIFIFYFFNTFANHSYFVTFIID
jgi:hypothetical protein